jgi:hypothetical protein
MEATFFLSLSLPLYRIRKKKEKFKANGEMMAWGGARKRVVMRYRDEPR